MYCTAPYATGIHPWLPKVSSEIYIFNFWIPIIRALYLGKQGYKDPWLFFEAERGPLEI